MNHVSTSSSTRNDMACFRTGSTSTAVSQKSWGSPANSGGELSRTSESGIRRSRSRSARPRLGFSCFDCRFICTSLLGPAKINDANSKSKPRSARFAALFRSSHEKRRPKHTFVYTLVQSAGDRRLTDSPGADSSPEQHRTSLGELPRRPRVLRNRVRASAAPRDRALRERRGLGRDRAPDLDEVVLREWRQDDHGVHTRAAFVLRRARAARPRILMPATASASNGRALPSSSCLRPAPTSERSCAMRASCSRSWASSSRNAARTTSLAEE